MIKAKSIEQRAKSKGHRAKCIEQSAKALSFYFVFSFLLFALCSMPYALCPVLYADVAGEEQAARIQQAYENIKDIKGNFVQKSYIKDLKRTDTYSGQFFIKPPKMKWEFMGNKPQAVYITGEDIFIYQKKEKQVFRTIFDRATYGQSPIALLGGFGNINKEFDVSMKKGNLILKPRKPMGVIVQIEITLSDGVFPIEALSILDTASNKIDITLKDVRINTGLDERIFAFKPPQDATVIQR